MKTTRLAAAAAMALASAATTAFAEEPFDACDVFTQAEASKILGASAEAEAVNAKVKRPKVIPTCNWWVSREGKTITASATFKFARNEADAQRAFEEEKLRFQTKPMLIGGVPAFWSAKQGTLQLLKGRTWLVVFVGGAKPADRDADASRKVAELLAKKL